MPRRKINGPMDINITSEDFANVYQLVNEALNNAEDNPNVKEDPINWADLSCSEVLYTISEKEEQAWIVFVSEASPDAWRLSNFVEKYLLDNNINGRCILEW